ncbi:hypothetical protein [Bradyrhizobium sp. DASA03120]|uniref:hypothetical protein n=1 Tax=Bradyrhizobium sp. SMVTL-02 TaxID=3395917 RepID=UPI003F72685E
MELFKAEKVGEADSRSLKTCRVCAQKLEHVRAILDSRSGKLIQMFKCRCGERTWDE